MKTNERGILYMRTTPLEMKLLDKFRFVETALKFIIAKFSSRKFIIVSIILLHRVFFQN